jgi:hypothetical protein
VAITEITVNPLFVGLVIVVMVPGLWPLAHCAGVLDLGTSGDTLPYLLPTPHPHLPTWDSLWRYLMTSTFSNCSSRESLIYLIWWIYWWCRFSTLLHSPWELDPIVRIRYSPCAITRLIEDWLLMRVSAWWFLWQWWWWLNSFIFNYLAWMFGFLCIVSSCHGDYGAATPWRKTRWWWHVIGPMTRDCDLGCMGLIQ